MDIDVSPLDFEIQRVLNSNFAQSAFEYSADFKIGDRFLPVLRVRDIDDRHDYQTDVAGDISIVVLVGLGDVTNILYPNRDNLELVLTREEVNSNTNAPVYGEETIVKQTYDAKLDPTIRPYGAENNDQDLPRETLNLADIMEVRVALKPKVAEEIAKVPTGGLFRNTTTVQLMRSLIKHYTDQLELPEEDRLLAIDVNLAQAADKVHGMVSIPHGTRLIDIPDHLQNRAGGVYPTGLGSFIMDRKWYIFPLFDTTRFDDSLDKMVIILVPTVRYPHVEKTYMVENNVTTVLITGEKKFQSDKERTQQVEGNGSVFTDASKIMSGFTDDKGGISILKRGTNNSEFVGETRRDGKNIVRMAPEEVTTNPFTILSRMARGQGHTILVTWRNADPRVIRPGKAIRAMYLNDGDVAQIDGVLIGSHTQVLMKGTGAMANGYEVVVSLFIYVRSVPGQNDFLGLN